MSKTAIELLRGHKDAYAFVEALDFTVDGVFTKALTSLARRDATLSAGQPNPRLVEQHIRDIASTLERALSYRRELDDLLAAALRQVLELEMLSDLAAVEEALERARTDKNAAATVRRKYEILQRHRAARQEAHTASGSALNFGERAGRIRRLLEHDLSTVVARVDAYCSGVGHVYGRTPPAIGEDLDDFVRWARNELLALDMIVGRSYESLWIFGLRQAHLPSQKPLLEAGEFDAQVKALSVSFTLNAGMFDVSASAKLRLRGLGISWDTDREPNALGAQEYHRFSVRCRLPAGAGGGEASVMLSAPMFRPTSLELLSSPLIHNANPDGPWTIDFRGGAVGHGIAKYLEAPSIVKDIKIALRLAVFDA